MVKALATLCFLGLLAGLVVAGVWFYMNPQVFPKADLPSTHLPRVTSYTVSLVKGKRQIKAIGTIVPIPGTRIVSRFAGRVANVYIEDGQYLAKGDPVIRLDDTQVRMAYQQLQMQLGMAQARMQLALMNPMGMQVVSAMPATQVQGFEGEGETIHSDIATETMVPGDVGLFVESPPAENVMASQREVNALMQRMHTLKKLMEGYTLVMPKPGKVEHLKVKRGEWISTETVIAEISSMKRPIIKAWLPPESLKQLSTGQPVLIQIHQPHAVFKAQGVIEGMQSVSEVKGTQGWVAVQATQGHASVFRPGKKAELMFPVSGPGSIWLPNQAIQTRQDRTVVYRLKARGATLQAIETPVVTGETMEEETEIISGLTPGEQIVLQGADRLQQKQDVVMTGTALNDR